MAKGDKKIVQGSGPSGSSTGLKRKNERFGFNIDKDVKLMKFAVNFNPWQLGESAWNQVANGMHDEYSAAISKRTCQDRVNLLVEKYKKSELSSKTGTENQRTERADLIREIIGLKEEAAAAIIPELGADDDDILEDNLSIHGGGETESNGCTQSTAPTTDSPTITTPTPTHVVNKKDNVRKERATADKEREEALDRYKREIADEPNSKRQKRRRHNEEELLFTQQEHDMDLEKKKFILEKDKHEFNFSIETSKIELEKFRLQIEQTKESRLLEESKRQYEIAMAQVNSQKTMFELVSTMSALVKNSLKQ